MTIIKNIIMRVNRITGVGLNAVACLRNVITEIVIVFLYTVVKQRKGADLNERKFEIMVNSTAVYL